MITILFDMDDTLYDQIEPFKKAYDTIFGKRFDVDIIELFEARSRRGDEVFELAQSGKMPMDEMHIYRIQKAFEDLGVAVTAEESLAYQRLYSENQGKISMTDTIISVLEQCTSCGVRLGMVTNGPSGHQRRKLRALGADRWIPEENIIISGECGVSKPNPEIFRYAEKKMKLLPGECIFVGDNYLNDIVGAKRAGWKAIWINKRGQDISGEEYQPDYIVADEAGLKDCIEQILKEEGALR
ncbi:MAG: HAD family hydrolase [Lachnospiraceae bacterium]|nr:HAD family hydrolase [Lachnospiraceae bacterium]